MTIVSGFLSSSPLSREAERLAQLSEGEGTHKVALTTPGFMVYLRVGSPDASDCVVLDTDAGVTILIVGRPLIRKGEPPNLRNLGWDAIPPALREIEGYWVAFAYEEKTKRLKVLCDRLGVAWIYWARTPAGFAFSSDFQALVRFLPGTPRIDDTACLLSLTLTYPLGESTCFEGISLVSPDTALEFDEGRVRRERLRTLEYGDRWVGASRAQKFEALDAALDASFRVWSLATPRPWVLALSSGKDSRYGLAQLLEHGERPSCFTFGLRGSPDVTGASAICRQEGLEHTLFDSGLKTSWQSWGSAVRRLGVIAGFQYVAGWGHEWRRTLSAARSKVVLGFLGDALSGFHLVDRFGGDWIANWEAWSLDLRPDGTWRGSQLIRPEVRTRAREAIRAAMHAEIEGHDFLLRHQIALHLDLYSRQRRATASQINFLTDEVSVAPLFYTRGMLEFWANLGYDDLRDQSLYLDFARTRFPAFFGPARRAGLYERAKGSLVNVVVDLWPGLRRHLKPQEIDIGAITTRHVERLDGLLRTCGDMVDHMVDQGSIRNWLVALREGRASGPDQLLRFWNLLILLELRVDDSEAHQYSEQ